VRNFAGLPKVVIDGEERRRRRCVTLSFPFLQYRRSPLKSCPFNTGTSAANCDTLPSAAVGCYSHVLSSLVRSFSLLFLLLLLLLLLVRLFLPSP
jgi:hypothetical protein